jgi:hypothetical protein
MREFNCGSWVAKADARFTMIRLYVRFDPSSWVVKGQQSKALLQHEKLHLHLAEYVAEKMSAKAEATAAAWVGKAGRRNENKDLATKEAKNAAEDRLLDHLQTFIDTVWHETDTKVQKAYESETKNGTDPVVQANWNTGWKTFADAVMAMK